MAHWNTKKSFAASLLEGLLRTVDEGDAAVERCLAGNARAGDQERVRAGLRVSELVLEQSSQKTKREPVPA